MGSGRVWGWTLELGWGQELRPLNCNSLGVAEGRGEMTQPVPASKVPSRPDLKLVASKEALENSARVDL